MELALAVLALLLLGCSSASALQLEAVDEFQTGFGARRALLKRNGRRIHRTPTFAGVGAGFAGSVLIGSSIGTHRHGPVCRGYNNTGFGQGGQYSPTCDCSQPNNTYCTYNVPLVGSAIGSHVAGSNCTGYNKTGYSLTGQYVQSCDCSQANNSDCTYSSTANDGGGGAAPHGGGSSCGSGCKAGIVIGAIIAMLLVMGLMFLLIMCCCFSGRSRSAAPPIGTVYGAQYPPQGPVVQGIAYPQGYPQQPPPGFNTGAYSANPPYPPPPGWEGRPVFGVPAPKPI